MRAGLVVVWIAFLVGKAVGQVATSPSVLATASIDDMKRLLDTAQRRGQLEMEGGSPFHLVASYEQFDAAGKLVGKGSVDELWEGPKQYRQILTVPEMEEVQLPKGGQSFRQMLDKAPRQLVEVDDGTRAWRTGRWVVFADFDRLALQPMALRSTVTDRLSAETEPVANTHLDCIGTEPDLPGVASDVRLALTTYCLAPGNHLLKLIRKPNGKDVLFNDIRPFGDKYIARTIEVRVLGKLTLRVHVDTLEAATEFTAFEVPVPEGAQVLSFHRADQPWRSGELMQGQLLRKVDPLYPQAGLRGTITVKIHIDTAGAVESEDVLEAQNQILKAPVLAALKEWRFRTSYQGQKVVPVDHIFRFSFGGVEQIQ